MLHVVLPQVSFKTIYLHLPGWFFHQVRPKGRNGATWGHLALRCLGSSEARNPQIPMFERFVQPFIIIFWLVVGLNPSEKYESQLG